LVPGLLAGVAGAVRDRLGRRPARAGDAIGGGMTKYGAIRTEVDGITFASKAEARRYAELKLMERAGAIKDLTLQPRYPIVVEGVPICTYVADFFYFAVRDDGRTWRPVIEDVKGVRTPVFKLKAKLVKALYGITVQEVAA
jgi:hypothetical protein